MQQVEIPGVRVKSVSGNKVYCFCPFHKEGQERSPSLIVFLDTGRWKCHACSPELGDARELMARAGNVSKAEADRRLLDLKAMAKEGAPIVKRPTCPEYLLGPFNRRPLSLVELGYSREVIDEMEVGWDEARARIIYPLRDPEGHLIGVMGGAVFSKKSANYEIYYGNQPKYLAYGPREGFPYQVDPKWSLWNYDRVVEAGIDESTVIVEGFKALMWVKMSGHRNVVALCGASFSQHQVTLLARLRGPFLVLLDNDAPGRQATVRLYRALKTKGVVAAARYPRQVHQPDDLTLDEVKRCLQGG